MRSAVEFIVAVKEEFYSVAARNFEGLHKPERKVPGQTGSNECFSFVWMSVFKVTRRIKKVEQIGIAADVGSILYSLP